MRQVRNGNIQFHSAALTTEVNSTTLRQGETTAAVGRLRRDRTATSWPTRMWCCGAERPADVVERAARWCPASHRWRATSCPWTTTAQFLQLQVPAGTPAGTYTWMSGAEPEPEP